MLVSTEKYQEFLKTLTHFNVDKSIREKLQHTMKVQMDFHSYFMDMFKNDDKKSMEFFLNFIKRESLEPTMIDAVLMALSKTSKYLDTKALFTAELMKRYAAFINYDKVDDLYAAIIETFEIYEMNKNELSLMQN